MKRIGYQGLPEDDDNEPHGPYSYYDPDNCIVHIKNYYGQREKTDLAMEAAIDAIKLYFERKLKNGIIQRPRSQAPQGMGRKKDSDGSDQGG